jgi:REP element-mobilizing transposase RayT
MHLTQRRLPHLNTVGQPLFVTFRLHGSLPTGRHFTSDTLTSGQAFVHLDRLLDCQSTGPLYLHMPDIARLVAHAILKGRQTDYTLHAWVVMPNHVHLLMTPLTNVSALMHRLKGTTARCANRELCRAGTPFWQHESYDRLVRDAQEFRRIENYIIQNPVRAGLAASPELYRWSSAWVTQAG